jgi:hypothetical protein
MVLGFKVFCFSHGGGNIAGSRTCCARVQAQGGSRVLQSLAGRREVLRRPGPLQISQAFRYSSLIHNYCVHGLRVDVCRSDPFTRQCKPLYTAEETFNVGSSPLLN